MRVIAGELGGRRLVTPRGPGVRPTSDRAREALFSILGDVSGFAVCDLFCGTGALGIEALSRGASEAVLVDRDIRPASVNVEALGLGDRAELVRRDASSYLQTTDAEFDLILCDPPYRLAARVARDLEKLVPGHLREGGRVAMESSAREPVELGMKLEADRAYGDVSIRIWTPA